MIHIFWAWCIVFFFAGTRTKTYGQSVKKDSFSIQLFAEVYGSLLPGQPANNKRPAYHYNYTKANGAGINLALAKAHYSSERFRTNFGVMAGDYPRANLAAERPLARNIYEFNAGFKLLKKHALWFDAGVLPSHIGMESAIGKDNPTATRSIIADNSPYYETGLRLSYQPNEQWYFAMLTLTGWQRITVPYGQKGSNWGTQITFKPSSKLTINSSSFIGKVLAGGRNVTRVYSNLYSTITITKQSALNLVWDLGLQEQEQNTVKTNRWTAFQAFYHYSFQPNKLAAAIRYERFIDRNNLFLVLPVEFNYKFIASHLSVNADWQPVKNLLLRTEFGLQSSPYPLFLKRNTYVTKQFAAVFVCSYNFLHTK